MLQKELTIKNDDFDSREQAYHWVVSSREYFADDSKFSRLINRLELRGLSVKECINLMGGVFEELFWRRIPTKEKEYESYDLKDIRECFNMLKLASLIAHDKFQVSNFIDAPTKAGDRWGGSSSFAVEFPRRLIGCMQLFESKGAGPHEVVAMLKLWMGDLSKVDGIKFPSDKRVITNE